MSVHSFCTTICTSVCLYFVSVHALGWVLTCIKVDLLLTESYCGTGGCSQKVIKEYGWFAFVLWKALEIGFLSAPIDWAPPWFSCLVSPCSLFCGRAENNPSIPLLSVQTKQKRDSMLTYLKVKVYHLLAFIFTNRKVDFFVDFNKKICHILNQSLNMFYNNYNKATTFPQPYIQLINR